MPRNLWSCLTFYGSINARTVCTFLLVVWYHFWIVYTLGVLLPLQKRKICVHWLSSLHFTTWWRPFTTWQGGHPGYPWRCIIDHPDMFTWTQELKPFVQIIILEGWLKVVAKWCLLVNFMVKMKHYNTMMNQICFIVAKWNCAGFYLVLVCLHKWHSEILCRFLHAMVWNHSRCVRDLFWIWILFSSLRCETQVLLFCKVLLIRRCLASPEKLKASLGLP